MRVLSTSEIENYLDFVLQNALNYNPRIYNSLFILKEIGCRASETQIQNWLYSGNNTYLLFTLKGRETRIFEQKELNQYFRTYVETRNRNLILNSYSALEYQFREASRGLTTFTNQKAIRTHLFRHWLMRKKSEQGETVEEIKTYFALKSNEIVLNYINEPIYANF